MGLLFDLLLKNDDKKDKDKKEDEDKVPQLVDSNKKRIT